MTHGPLPAPLAALLSALSLLLAVAVSVVVAPAVPAIGPGPAAAAAPVAAELRTSSVRVDGRDLFQVWPTEELPSRERVAEPNRLLQELVRRQDPWRLSIGESNRLPVIRLDGQVLLTVTERDVPEGMTQLERARQWRDRIGTALREGRRQRRPPGRLRGVLRSLLAVAAALVFSRLLGRLRRRRALIVVLVGVLQLLIWLAASLAIADSFPELRIWSSRISRSASLLLSAPLIPIGEQRLAFGEISLLLAGLVAWTWMASWSKNNLRRRVLSVTDIAPGTQDTITSVFQILLLALGILVLLQIAGIDLSSLALFAGVVGVGIGFGLQDITKNLISGVVLLFEKPIQTGDFVELGDLCGTVQGIRLRSTVIRTIDHIAIIVPNSEFLDRQVVNWSHHDSVSRLRLSVGVAYGSDTQRVRRSLLEAARQCAQVLSVPAPEVQFTGFGDSSLDFLLLVWIRDPGDQFTVTSDLNFAIDARFRLAGIQIPFPQRDVHLRGETVRVSLDPDSLRGLRELGEDPGEGAPGGGTPVP